MSMVPVQRLDMTDYDPGANGNGGGQMIELATTRAAQEVQASMIIAKKFPRDENRAFARIMQACKRRTLAEQAIYSYPRGGTKVEGPSIRLAEAMARAWGNIDFGIVELEQRHGESTMMSYAWDLETNVRQTRIFTIRHERHTRDGAKPLTDPRDIYEMAANTGARRLRACILGLIPGDVVDVALDECTKTMAGNNSEPLADRARAMVVAFADLGVTQDMIEGRLSHKLDAISEAELVQLRKVYTSIRDGHAGREQYFQTAAPKTGDLAERAKQQSQQQPPPRPAATAQAAPPASAGDSDAGATKTAPADPSPAPAAGPSSSGATAKGRAEKATFSPDGVAAAEQRQPAPAEPTVDASTSQVTESWEDFEASMWAVVEPVNADRERFNAAMLKGIKGAKKKSGHETTAFDRELIARGIAEQRGYWAYLQPETEKQ